MATDTKEKEENSAPPSKWEWLPVGLTALMGILYFAVAEPGGSLARFAFFLGLGLLPGSLWRVLGHHSWGVHRICFAVTLLAFVFNNPALRPDGASVYRLAGRWPLVLLGFVIAATQPLWAMLRTDRLLNDSGVMMTWNDSFKLCLAGSFFNIFLPGTTGGDAYRVYGITNGYKTRLAPSIASITLDRLLSLPSLIFILLVGMLLDYSFFRGSRMLAGMIPLISGAASVCFALVVYLIFAGKVRRRSNWTRPFESHDGKIGWFKRTHLMIATNVKRRWTLPLTLFYGVLAHLACIVPCLCFGMALGVDGVPPIRYFLIVPLVMTINSIPGAPGGVGQGELAMATFLQMASPGSANAQDGVMIMLLFRLSNMFLGLVGGVYYALDKFDFSGIDYVSQGVTRILTRKVEGEGMRFPAGLTQRYEKVKEEVTSDTRRFLRGAVQETGERGRFVVDDDFASRGGGHMIFGEDEVFEEEGERAPGVY